MQATKKLSLKSSIFAGLCGLVLSWGLLLPSAFAQENPRQEAAATPINISAATSPGKRYFVEFRSRSALSYGHTFLVHGKLNAKGEVGQVTKDQVAGLHPATESSVPWAIGHLIPVISETGASDGDTEDEYVTAGYRILLTEQEYAKVSGFIRHRQKNSPLWHAVLYNCNAWVADIAKFMMLKTPESTMLYPEEFVSGMAKLNGGAVVKPRLTPATATAAAPKPPTSAAKPSTNAAKPATSPKPQTVATPAASAEARTVR